VNAADARDPEYQAEQAKLRRQQEGTPSEEDLVIEVPKDPEVNPIVYKDVEPILFRGFLTAHATVNDVPIVFKSLNHHEFERINMVSGTIEGHTQRFWNVFLAYSVFLFDGINVLADRAKSVQQLVRLFDDIPRPARERIIRPLSEVNRRATNAIRLTEAFAMEWQSRYRWVQLKGLDLTTTAVTGIEGTDRLGLNWGQLTWRAVNQFEDLKEQHEREWENAKFIGSCMAGKGISKVYQQDSDRRQKDREQRLARKDAVLREVVLGEDPNGERLQKNGAVLVVAHTAEELAEQLTRDLRGEKDFHDFVVDQAQHEVKRAEYEQKQRIVELARTHQEEMGNRFLSGGTDMRGITAAEVRQRAERQRTYEAQLAAQRIVPVNQPGSDAEKDEAFKEKWGLSPGNIPMSDDDPSNAMPVHQSRPRQTPFRR
jgi:hypothetical protein